MSRKNVLMILAALLLPCCLALGDIVSYDYYNSSGSDPEDQGWTKTIGGTSSISTDGYDTALVHSDTADPNGWRIVDGSTIRNCYYTMNPSAEQSYEMRKNGWTLTFTFSLDSGYWPNDENSGYTPANFTNSTRHDGIIIDTNGTDSYAYFIVPTVDPNGNLAIADEYISATSSLNMSTLHVLTTGGDNALDTQYTVTITYDGTDAILSYSGNDFTLHKTPTRSIDRMLFGGYSTPGMGSTVYYEVDLETVSSSPELFAPIDNSCNLSADVDLEWRAGTNIEYYKVYISDTLSEVQNRSVTPLCTASTFLTADLDYDTTYYWVVDGVAEGLSFSSDDIWSFATKNSYNAIASYDYNSLSSDPEDQGWTYESNYDFENWTSGYWVGGYDTATLWQTTSPAYTGPDGWRVIDASGVGYSWYKTDLTTAQSSQLNTGFAVKWTFSMDRDAWGTDGTHFSDDWYVNNNTQTHGGLLLETYSGFRYYLYARTDTSGNLVIYDGNTSHVLTSDGGNNAYETSYSVDVVYDGTDAILSYGGNDYTLYDYGARGIDRILIGSMSTSEKGSLVYQNLSVNSLDSFNPTPSDGELYQTTDDTEISWELPEPINPNDTKDDLKVDVFISTNSDMSNATQLVDYQNATSVSVSLTSGTKYYWCVDVYDPQDGGTEITTEGPIWSFTFYRGKTMVDVVDEDLDMATQLKNYESIIEEETGPALVEYGPRLVAGQGDDEDNYTVVRVLNKFQISELQFLAYPTSVRGGVNVGTGLLLSDDMAIATCPISDTSTREIRVFTENGQLVKTFEPSTVIATPFVIAVGNFVPNNGYEEIAIAAVNQGPSIHSSITYIKIYTGNGQYLYTFAALPGLTSNDTLTMSTDRVSGPDKLLLYYQNSKKALVLDTTTGNTTSYSLSSLPADSTIYESAFEDELFVAGAPETTYSTLYSIDDQASVTSIDAGARENKFWIHNYSSSSSWTESQYIKHGYYRHIRPDYKSDNYDNPDFSSDVYRNWVGNSVYSYINSQFSSYYSGLPSIWEPTFTHRHASVVLPTEWYNEEDDGGFNKYMMLNCYNEPISYTEVTGTFDCLTYATDLPAIDRLYLWPQRAFLRNLALHLRGPDGDAEQMVGVEPNHEFEIPDDPNAISIGDYNPKMISGFYNHLIKRHTTIARINSLFGTSFTGPSNFDAPRNSSRGSWDAYSTSNEFYNAWIEYNRKVIFNRIAQGFREALIAGIPPEAIKTHQIPQGYAMYQPITNHRITPIDWIFTAGTGYGGTRYGLWYTKQYNWLQGAFSSGQTMVSAGEYDPQTTNQTYANEQLSYMFNNGVNFVHHMTDSDPTVVYNSCISLQDEGPRLGTTGGIGQVRAVVQPTDYGTKPYNIVCIGTGENHNGLLKSVNEDGSWEGTVYVTPFHAAIDIDVIGTEDNYFDLTTSDYSTGTISDLMAGDQIEIRFKARTDDQDGELTLLPLHTGMELAGHRKYLQIDDDWGYYSYILRIQSPMEGVMILMTSGRRDTSTAYTQDIEIEDFSVLVHKDQVTRKRYGIDYGTPHAGGVTFDILSDSHKAY